MSSSIVHGFIVGGGFIIVALLVGPPVVRLWVAYKAKKVMDKAKAELDTIIANRGKNTDA